jgi:hypothetical protein
MKLSDIVSEGTVTQLKKMRDVRTGKDVMVNMDHAKEISMLDAFAPTLGALSKLGLKVMEKPSYWEDLDAKRENYKPWTELELRRAEKELGGKFPRVKSETLLPHGKKKGPMQDMTKPDWDQAIVEFPDGTKYFADSTQARSYIRMWAKIE